MNLIGSNYDIIFYGIILLSALWALFKGAVAEILSLGVWFFAFWFMRTFGNIISAHLPAGITNQLLRSIVAFILFFIILAIIATILKKICTAIIRSIGLVGLNYTLGLMFGIIRGILICAILIIVIAMFRLDPSNSWEKATLYPILSPVVKWIAHAIPQQI